MQRGESIGDVITGSGQSHNWMVQGLAGSRMALNFCLSETKSQWRIWNGVIIRTLKEVVCLLIENKGAIAKWKSSFGESL